MRVSSGSAAEQLCSHKRLLCLPNLIAVTSWKSHAFRKLHCQNALDCHIFEPRCGLRHWERRSDARVVDTLPAGVVRRGHSHFQSRGISSKHRVSDVNANVQRLTSLTSERRSNAIATVMRFRYSHRLLLLKSDKVILHNQVILTRIHVQF